MDVVAISLGEPDFPPFSGESSGTAPSTAPSPKDAIPLNAAPWAAVATSATPPASLSGDVLAGSWYVVAGSDARPSYQGTLRISPEEDGLAVSADLYALTDAAAGGPLPRAGEVMRSDDGHWYPQPSRSGYAHHLRSMGGTAANGELTVRTRCFDWVATAPGATSNRVGDFATMADTILTLRLEPALYAALDGDAPTLVLRGTVTLGGTPVEVWAAKTSPYLRGIRLFLHEMEERTWPEDADYSTSALCAVFEAAGLDLTIERPGGLIPSDPQMLRSELDKILADAVIRFEAGPLWVLHLLLVSRLHWSALNSAGTFGNIAGMMFDDTDRHRQGTAIFCDAEVSSSMEVLQERIDPAIRGRPLGQVAPVLLRTTAHEIGHALGLKHTGAKYANDRGIMNQIQELLRQVDPASGPLFPDNAVMAFGAVDCMHLRHRPDPEVCPGWGNWGVPPKGVDLGLQPYDPPAQGYEANQFLSVGLAVLPANELASPAARRSLRRAFDLGEPVFAEVTLENISDRPITVPAAITLADGLCELAVLDEGKERRRVIGSAQPLCEGVGITALAPGETRRDILQIHCSGNTPIFHAAGAHVVELAVKTVEHGWVEAASSIVVVREDPPLIRRTISVTGRQRFCESLSLGYLSSRRAVEDTDRLIHSVEYALGARLVAAVLQVATFAEESGNTENSTRACPVPANALRVDRAIDHIRMTGVTKAVALAVAEAIDPLSDGETPAALAIEKAMA